MSRKLIIVISAAAMFVLGAVFASIFPKIAALIVLLELCGGFGCGFFFSQELTKEEQEKLQEEVKKLNQALKDTAEKKIRITTKKKVTSENKEA